jgi:hypothetical protein
MLARDFQKLPALLRREPAVEVVQRQRQAERACATSDETTEPGHEQIMPDQ